MKSRTVYSTDKGRLCPECSQAIDECICKSQSKTYDNDGFVRVARETKGRKGKGVTLIEGIPGNEKEIKAFAKTLKQKCSCGGSVKDGVIEIQGDQRQVIKTYLEKNNFKVKLVGG